MVKQPSYSIINSSNLAVSKCWYLACLLVLDVPTKGVQILFQRSFQPCAGLSDFLIFRPGFFGGPLPLVSLLRALVTPLVLKMEISYLK